MARRRSRLSTTEEKKNIRRAIIFVILTIIAVIALIFLGLPLLAKYAGLLTDVRKSSEPVQRQDSTPPSQPKLDPLPEATNEREVEVSGTTEPGATVVLFLNSSSEEVLANKNGEFKYTFRLNAGENEISAKAKDNSGNESQKSKEYIVIFDNDDPSLEISNPQDGGEYFGSKQRQIVIEGVTEEDASVNVNDRVVIVESDGSFAFATTLVEGENTFTVKATDEAGNTKEIQLTLSFTP